MREGKEIRRGFLNILKGEPNRKYLEAQEQKFAAPVSEMDMEQFINSITPQSSQKSKFISNYIDKYKQSALVVNDQAKAHAAAIWEKNIVEEKVGKDIDREFAIDFYWWLQGRGKDIDHQKTPWGRSPIRDEEVLAYVTTFIEAKIDFQQRLFKLSKAYELGPLKGIFEHYLYFKYIVRASPDLDSAEFLKDYELYFTPTPLMNGVELDPTKAGGKFDPGAVFKPQPFDQIDDIDEKVEIFEENMKKDQRLFIEKTIRDPIDDLIDAHGEWLAEEFDTSLSEKDISDLRKNLSGLSIKNRDAYLSDLRQLQQGDIDLEEFNKRSESYIYQSQNVDTGNINDLMKEILREKGKMNFGTIETGVKLEKEYKNLLNEYDKIQELLKKEKTLNVRNEEIMNEYLTEMNEYSDEAKEMEQKITNQNATIEELKKDISFAHERISAESEKSYKLDKMIPQLKAGNDFLKTQLKKAEDEKVELLKSNQSGKEELLKEKEDQITKYEKELENLTNKLDIAKANAIKYQESVTRQTEDQQKEIASLKQDIENLKKQNTEASEQHIKEKERLIQEQQEEINLISAKIQKELEIEKTEQILKAKMTFEQENKDIKEEFEKRKKSLKEHIADLNATIAKLENKLDLSKASEQKKTEQQSANIKSLEIELTKLHKDLSEKEAKLDEITKESSEKEVSYKNQIEALVNQRDALKEDVFFLEEEVTRVKKKFQEGVEQLKEKLEPAKIEFEQIQEELKNFNEKHEQIVQKSVDEAQEQVYHEAREFINNLKQKHAEQIQQLQNEINQLKSSKPPTITQKTSNPKPPGPELNVFGNPVGHLADPIFPDKPIPKPASPFKSPELRATEFIQKLGGKPEYYDRYVDLLIRYPNNIPDPEYDRAVMQLAQIQYMLLQNVRKIGSQYRLPEEVRLEQEAITAYLKQYKKK